ncbi:MAG: 2-oxo acid dehydrogenase subunit E2, partial [Psittacicella sp.]
EVPAPFAGTVSEIIIKQNDMVTTGSFIMKFSTGAAAPAAQASVATPAKEEVSTPVTPAAPASTGEDISKAQNFIHATPLVRELAREFGLNLDKIKGTGRKDRITKEDVQNYVKGIVKQVENGSVGGNSMGFDLIAWPKLNFDKFGETEVVPLGKIQKISGANLHRNWVRIPHVTQWDQADITDVEKFRKDQNAIAAKRKLEVKYTPLVFIMKAVAKALEVYPKFNTSLSEDGTSLIYKKFINLGIAVDTPNGLVVPVIKDVNKKTITELSIELGEISKKARAGKLTGSDMQGGTFTISSLGGIGGTQFTPIINAPEVAILGVSKSTQTPVWNGSAFVPRLMLPLSLSYDHRVIDGADGARFISFLSNALADMRNILM